MSMKVLQIDSLMFQLSEKNIGFTLIRLTYNKHQKIN